jgi:hypothetical protein
MVITDYPLSDKTMISQCNEALWGAPNQTLINLEIQELLYNLNLLMLGFKTTDIMSVVI